MKEADYKEYMYLSRPQSRHYPMAVERRAKQFAPFAALKGFEETIQEEEKSYGAEFRDEADEKLHPMSGLC